MNNERCNPAANCLRPLFSRTDRHGGGGTRGRGSQSCSHATSREKHTTPKDSFYRGCRKIPPKAVSTYFSACANTTLGTIHRGRSASFCVDPTACIYMASLGVARYAFNLMQAARTPNLLRRRRCRQAILRNEEDGVTLVSVVQRWRVDGALDNGQIRALPENS